MDAKVTLSFDSAVIESAKKYAEKQGISLSRLTEFLLRKVTAKGYTNLEDFPVSDWVNLLAEGQAEYITKKRGRKKLKEGYFKSKK